jgi:RNA pseudouridylate synthase
MPAASQLAVAFEDDHLACVVKPQGIPTQASIPTCLLFAEAVPLTSRQSEGCTVSQDCAAYLPDTTAAQAIRGALHMISDIQAARAKPVCDPQAHGPLLDVHSRLLHSLAASAAPGALARPRHAHRLDSPTGGLLLVGKTHAAVAALCSMFVDRWA